MSPSFAELGVPKDLVAVLRRNGINDPFEIQSATIPDAMNGRDVLGRAPTGSGKTLAFGLPLVAKLREAKPHRPTALILSPTRELAEQIRRELAPLAEIRGLRTLAIYGGVGFGPQLKALREGVDLVVACPGRLLDLIEQRQIILDDVRYAVVDEADRMADMGFLP
ncbi:MAG: DEAD/DEAH box helicase, partial [Acidimicrobiales bacterium]